MRNNEVSERLAWAVLHTVAYADIFNYPLTAAEIQRYLIGAEATPAEVDDVLRHDLLCSVHLSEEDGLYSLAGHETAFACRRRRAELAGPLWDAAYRYGQWIGDLPFVRMVAVTGSLAVDNTEPGGDIDYLIVTAPGRLWLARLLVVALVRWSRRSGYTLCPNYFVTENALEIAEQDLYVAREISQMVPIAGPETYETMRRLNAWTGTFIPNALSTPADHAPGAYRGDGAMKRAAERVLGTPIGGWLDRWEMQRKIRKFNRQDNGAVEVDFTPDQCKGHFDGHRQRIMAAYHQRLDALQKTAAAERIYD